MELERRFSSEEQCREYLAGLRWPDGFQCSKCGGADYWVIDSGRMLCRGCRKQVSVLAGTIFHGTHLSLATWFRAMWYVTSQKGGVSALGLQRVLGLGSYRTAWAMLHKLRAAMVRPGREQLNGTVEVDEAFWGAAEQGVYGRLTITKALIIVAAEEDGAGIGRIRMQRIPDMTRASLHGFIGRSIERGSTVRTDGWSAYLGLEGYTHLPEIQKQTGDHLLPRVHRVVSLFKRWVLGTHQGAISHQHLDSYLDEFTFRFNRRKSGSRGKLFFRLAQQAVQIPPKPYASVIKPQQVGAG